jgi:hypothetical protein
MAASGRNGRIGSFRLPRASNEFRETIGGSYEATATGWLDELRARHLRFD